MTYILLGISRLRSPRCAYINTRTLAPVPVVCVYRSSPKYKSVKALESLIFTRKVSIEDIPHF
ncbi:hypothetical protein CY34DRAFT_807310 [Suillus luteus UH-Slu-Lm8-n1]|uniref:Uncharacterized protein n=1 Tax=Suillus luteus UH-Slu-Lm8-n1 TaxID=930992 RepID=A0A0D0B9L2_9AGAM|nr:hypothetical protein CY34DRAFT_807310 [Suillus luteus UH-Slu-Lm8-n1]